MCYGISAAILSCAGLRLAGHILREYPWKYISGARLDLPATRKPYRLNPVSPHDVSTKIFGTLYVLLKATQYSKLQNGCNDAFMKPVWIEIAKPHTLGLEQFTYSVINSAYKLVYRAAWYSSVYLDLSV
jgi:hypothetical protein